MGRRAAPGALQLNAGNWVLPRRENKHTHGSSAAGILRFAPPPSYLRARAFLCGGEGARPSVGGGRGAGEKVAGATPPAPGFLLGQPLPRASRRVKLEPWQPGTEASKPRAPLSHAGIGRLLRRRFPGLPEAFRYELPAGPAI